jgi:hypothetical protein
MSSGRFTRAWLTCAFVAGSTVMQAQGLPTASLNTTDSSTRPAGIKPIDANTLAQAIADGEAGGGSGAYLPFEMRASDAGRAKAPGARVPPNADVLFGALSQPPPFYFSVSTPYSATVALAKQAMERYEGRPTVTAEEMNEMQVLVFVGPPDDLARTDSVKAAYLKRGTQTIQPLYQELTAVQVPIDGQTRSVRTGDFTFPFAAFEPTSDIVLVMVGERGTYEWTITADELGRMR